MQSVSMQTPQMVAPRFGNADEPSKADALKEKAKDAGEAAKAKAKEVKAAAKEVKELSPEERKAALSQLKNSAGDKVEELTNKAKSAFKSLKARLKKED